MSTVSSLLQDRRRFSRGAAVPGVDIRLLRSGGHEPADHINISRGGLCVRLRNGVEVRSILRLLLVPSAAAKRGRPVECTGRVAWVVERQDLREGPPFPFDVGIEFVDPPLGLRQFLARQPGAAAAAPPAVLPTRALAPVVIRSRRFVPHLVCEAGRGRRWHLVVSVDEAPCFSGRYASARTAGAAWESFKRRQARARRAPHAGKART